MAIPTDTHASKEALRKNMRSLLAARHGNGDAVANAVSHWVSSLQPSTCIAVFAALPDEVDLIQVVLAHPQHIWVYPRVNGEALHFHRIDQPQQQLLPGAFGILEPSAQQPQVEIDRIDVFLCPGLAFDPDGGRLGRGRGFYDRMLAAARPDAIKVGVCFPFQLVPATHGTAHDIRMDRILTTSEADDGAE